MARYSKTTSTKRRSSARRHFPTLPREQVNDKSKISPQSELERLFDKILGIFAQDIPAPTKEHQFALSVGRYYRFDRAWPSVKLAVEIDGGEYAFNGGRHNTNEDRWKINLANSMGWAVLRFSGSMLRKEPQRCIEMVRFAYSNLI